MNSDSLSWIYVPNKEKENMTLGHSYSESYTERNKHALLFLSGNVIFTHD